ncbi:MAG: sugar phosphate nucleotidyltransferase [Bacteroidia bacterium]|nr:sugar phosphate nucleotidyltransferase [Bacteroidia bacterium]
MKAVIPVAGAGVRLRPHTHTQPKPLIPIAGKPILGHLVERLLENGIEEYIFVVGYMGEKIENYISEEFKDKIRFHFVRQEPRLGLAHAVGLCKNYLEEGKFLIALGDTIIDADFKTFFASEVTTFCVQEVEDPRSFGVAVLNEEGDIRSLVEKPTIPKSNLALVGLYLIHEPSRLFEAIDYLMQNQIKTRGEYHLTDALMRLIESGVKMRTFKVNRWYDCGKKEILLETNRTLLDRLEPTSYSFGNSVIIPPVSIAPHVVIENSIIGPYVAIAEHTEIRDSIIQNSILGAYARLDSIILKNSIIGNDTTLIGKSQSVNIGDSTEINFNE